MNRYLALRDRRLEGGVPARPRLGIINTDEHTPLAEAFARIRGYVRLGRIHTLYILCHGYAGENPRGRVSMDAGGMGLQLGREDVTHANVGQWSAIKGGVANIVVHSCAAADTQPGNQGSVADGRYLMGALAIHTGADVYAADIIQWYHNYKDNLKRGRFEFGEWEGNLWHFPPNGAGGGIVPYAPVELADVFAGG